ncbi:MAG: DNA polymerase III subunit [Polyangiaceae bacterium]
MAGTPKAGAWLATVRGQEVAVGTLSRALRAGRVHHAYLFEGPDGVGKERTAFGVAQALVCENPKDGSACGECSACHRALLHDGQKRPLHPDVCVIARGLYDPQQIGRKTPETQDISVDQVRSLVLARAAFGPHEGRAKVFIVRAAEELSLSAANALLKTLEEPGKNTYFILLSSSPDALLPTVRSRTMRIRFGSLPNSVIVEGLVASGVVEPEAEKIALVSNGSFARAAAIQAGNADTEGFSERVRSAVRAQDFTEGLELAADAKRGKDELIRSLENLLVVLEREARSVIETDPALASRLARRHAATMKAIDALYGNAAPQLTTENLLLTMRSL